MAEDEEDFIFYGTPIEREEDTSARKRKAVADAGQLRSLPTWKQEARDEEGRRRFHGAFTGGYSAGYYNTVGSKEGWTPQMFTSSRKNRAETKKQTIYSFLDDEDMKDMGGHILETSSQFDTFGFTAAEVARKQAEKEQQKRPSAIPGPVPDEIVVPAANSIGVKLLVKMGWRHGHAIKETRTDSLYDARREARKALLAFSGNNESSEPSQVELSKTNLEEVTERYDDVISTQSTPVYVLYPKQDFHGLGYDPFKHAPEFRDRKRSRKDQSSKPDASARSKLLGSTSGKYAPGFGIGALEELDVEDEDIYASGFDYVGTEVEEEEPSRATTENKLKLEYRKQGVLSGFKVASSSEYNLERFYPPDIPPDFEPFHKFPSRPESVDKFAEAPPPEVPPPENDSLKLLIEGIATLVARCGKLFEDLSKEKNRSNPLFSFLSGGNGYQYYARRLWEAKQKTGQRVDTSDDRKMTAEGRGRILGEKPLERSANASTTTSVHKEVIHFQSNLSDSFAKPTSFVDSSERAKPFKDDPAKQERFEQFLKDKYQGGLRSTYYRSTTTMSETDRARERLDFEAAAEAIEKGEWSIDDPSSQQGMNSLGGDSRFVSSSTVEKHQISKVEEKMVDKIYPKREEFQWRPSSLLCKRFDLIDPYMGKPPPPPRARSKFDALIFMPDAGPSAKIAEANPSKLDAVPISQSEPQESEKKQSKDVPDAETNSTSVQRPVDLYKAIFSDDSDDEVENVGISDVADSEKKIEGANTTLNRLVAGDFLESLGKELGLEVPPDRPCPVNKTNSSSSLTETYGRTDIKTSSRNDKSAPTLEIPNAYLVDEKISNSKNVSGGNSASGKEAAPADQYLPNHAETVRRGGSVTTLRGEAEGDFSDCKDDRCKKKEHRSRKHRSHSRHHRYSSGSDTDPSSSHGYYDHTKSRSEKRASSKRKSRKHPDHHSRERSRSPTRYSSRDVDRDLSDDGRKDRRSRGEERHSRKKHH